MIVHNSFTNFLNSYSYAPTISQDIFQILVRLNAWQNISSTCKFELESIQNLSLRLSGIQTKEQHMNLKAYILHFFPVYLDFWSVFKVFGLNAKPENQILKGLWCEFSKTLIPLCFGKAWLQNDLENTCTEQLYTLDDFDIFHFTFFLSDMRKYF